MTRLRRNHHHLEKTLMKTKWIHLAQTVIAFTCLLAAPTIRAADAYPAKPVKVLVGFAAGSTTDTIARIVAHALSAKLGQPFVVENKTGANGLIAANTVAGSKADGYTLLLANSSSMTINPLLYKDAQYKTLKDFVPISPILTGHFTIATNPKNPRTATVKSFNDLIALAKAKPGTVSYGSGGVGNFAHLGGELLSGKFGIRLIHVPYRASSQARAALLAGDLDFGFETPSVIGQVKSGTMTALAVTSTNRWSELPDVPTVAESLPGFEVVFWFGLFTPAGTPEEVVRMLNREIVAAVNNDEVRAQLASQGSILTLSPEAFATKIGAEIEQYAEVIRRANIKID